MTKLFPEPALLPGDSRKIERFPASDLEGLRQDLRQCGIDTWQIASMIGTFLTERGYGVSLTDASQHAAQSEVLYGSLDRMQAGLEALAVTM